MTYEYDRPVDYSMPRQCGLYPPPPYKYPHMRAIISMFQCPAELKKKYLPEDFEPMDLFDVAFITEYPDSTIGPYYENLILLYCSYKGDPGAYVFNIYVDSDIALAAGREIWGYPKKFCDMKLSELKDNKIQGSLTRMGITFLEIEAELGDRPPGIDIQRLIEILPIYNVKIIPDVADPTKPALRQVTKTILGIDAVHKQLGGTTTKFETKYSRFDICDEFIKESKKDLGSIYVEADMVLPPGIVLD